jgi:diaminopimelate epimerase
MEQSFVKYSGNGNDFIIMEDSPLLSITAGSIQRICDRHFGVGADGVILLGKSPGVDASMRIFNSDGGEAEMCGNGLRCLATYIDAQSSTPQKIYTIKTSNNTYQVFKRGSQFAILMNEIKDKNAFDLSMFNDFEKKFYINTGVPHLVFLSKDARTIDIKKTAPLYRFHPLFPQGTNVSFVEVLPETQSAYARTYERGVEDETHSCGTGLTASGLALTEWFGWSGDIHLRTLGGNQTVSVGNDVYYSGEVTFCFSGKVIL